MAFRVDSTDTYTYATNSTGGTVDLGARNNYRYVNAEKVYAKGKADGTSSKSMSVSWTRSGPYSNPDRYYITFNVTVNGSRKVSAGFNAYTESVPASFSYSV